MSNKQKEFIKLLEQQPCTESYVSRVQLIISRLVAESRNLSFKTTIDLNAVQVSKGKRNVNHTYSAIV
ncbi:hypothetical protein CWE06_12150 [Aliidiomarina haloalkalitolerans]|uniref:Uncharacterized protein n=1 Tax=Aliidiomarina haloalkalitolerans TaxID=859059 RepID=A0A432VPT4_9GAMM|nr:hypothetical protein CWE06_12150 [Aliidiomarina haloalkalitolerans]